MTLIVNLFGGPGIGKSTVAAGVFHNLKLKQIDCELVTEYAKEIVWEESFKKLNNQLYIFAKQHNRVFRCLDKVDVIVTDSPVNLGLIYGDTYHQTMSDQLRDLIRFEFARHNNLNVVLNRVVPYNNNGRMQDPTEAETIDAAVKHILDQDNHEYIVVDGDDASVPTIIDQILLRLNR